MDIFCGYVGAWTGDVDMGTPMDGAARPGASLQGLNLAPARRYASCLAPQKHGEQQRSAIPNGFV
jgi:hypothetical protein